MKIKVKPFWRVEVWSQDIPYSPNIISSVEYYDNQAEAESRAKQILQESVDCREAEEWDRITVADITGEVVKAFTAEIENEALTIVEH